MALLSVLHQLAPAWNFSLTIIHCNYGLRGAESEGDASFVTDLCRRLNLPCLVRSLNIPSPHAGLSSSLQARARELRYRLFRDLSVELGVDRVALGHTADDQAETVLLRMLRGAGLRGLAGMPHSRGHLFVRPLLTVTRREILSYLDKRGLSFRTRPIFQHCNTSIYLRCRVRPQPSCFPFCRFPLARPRQRSSCWRASAELGADRALGHTADDQAETGYWIRGLAGMPHSRGHLFVRPLLTVRVARILKTMGLSWTDSSKRHPSIL